MKEKGLIKAGICLGCCLSILVTSGCGIFPFSRERDREISEIGIEETTQTPIPTTEVQTTEPETVNNSAKLNELGIPNNLKVENNASIKKGDWGAFYVWNYDTDSVFTVYMKVDKLTAASDDSNYVNSSIAEYNKGMSESRQLTNEDLNKNVEYAVADVSLYIPAGQNVKDYIGVPLPLSVNIKGNGSWKDESGMTYIFTTNVYKEKQDDKKFSAGDSCQTKLIYPILKKTTTPYNFECSYQTPSNDSNYNKITFELKS